MSKVICPHCNAQNTEGAAFCEACGKAIPTSSTTPRVIEDNETATTATGQELQAKQLRQMSRRAVGPLIFVGIVNLAVGILFLFVLEGSGRFSMSSADCAALLVVGTIFFALGIWARSNPLPASIVGLVLYVTLIVVGAVLNPESLVQGIIVKILIIVVLAKAIQAGVRFKALKAEVASRALCPVSAQETPVEG